MRTAKIYQTANMSKLIQVIAWCLCTYQCFPLEGVEAGMPLGLDIKSFVGFPIPLFIYNIYLGCRDEDDAVQEITKYMYAGV